MPTNRANSRNAVAKPPVYLISLAQLGMLSVLCLALLLIDKVLAYSVALGGLIAIGPQAYFANRVFRFRGAKSAKQMANASYGAEVIKFVLTAAGFACVFALVRPIDGLAVFAGFIGMLVIHSVGALLISRRR